MNLKTLSDEALLSQTLRAVAQEREMTLTVLHHLREVEDRRLYARNGCSTLFDYAISELKYSGPAAQRRIDAMKLLREVPEMESKVQDGAVSLSTLAQAHGFFKKEDQADNPISLNDKKEILQSLENLSTRHVEKALLQRSSQPEIHLKERVRPVTPSLNEIKFYADDQLTEDLDTLKGLLAHSHPGMTISELVRYLADLGLKKLDSARKASRSKAVASSASSSTGTSSTPHSPATSAPSDLKTADSIPAPEIKHPQTRYIPAQDKREVWKRDHGRCGFRDPQTGRLCGSRYRIQFDHIIPFALRGPNTKENLRLRCQTHNRLHAEQVYGRERMRSYCRS